MDEHAFTDTHDRFFRFSFSELEVPSSLLAQHLPADVVRCLDLNSLRLIDGSFVDEELRRSQSDLLFECNLRQTDEEESEGAKTSSVCVYLLLEHKSYPDPLTPFQLLKYVVRILERRLREGLPLCCVIPLVVYHGDCSWDVARSLDELIEVPQSLQSYVPRFSIPLFDLSEIPDERLGGDAFSQAALLLLKYIRRPELVRRLGEILETLRPILLEAGDEARLQAVLVYVAGAAPQLQPEQLAGILESTFPKQGQALMATIAEQWMNQGREEGREEGLEKGRLIGTIQTCKAMLDEPLDEAALGRMSLEELQRLATELQRRVRKTPRDR